jgi:hypothetical protein
MSHDDETDSAPSVLRARLELASREKLIEVIERLAADSAESAARINYLTDSSAAVKMLERRISSIRSGKRFVSYGESRNLAAEIATIAADIRADLLITDPAKAMTLAEKLFSCRIDGANLARNRKVLPCNQSGLRDRLGRGGIARSAPLRAVDTDLFARAQ